MFRDNKELLRFARRFIKERIDSLKKDVERCLENDAAFPALLYCFSTIDLLGALLNGCAHRNCKTTQQSKDYIKKYMHYTDDQIEKIQNVFRHKIVHLAQPNSIVTLRGKNITWHYWHNNTRKHLKSETRSVMIRSIGGAPIGTPLYTDEVFNLSIWTFFKDIKRSVYRKSNGYLYRLSTNIRLRRKFKSAIEELIK